MKSSRLSSLAMIAALSLAMSPDGVNVFDRAKPPEQDPETKRRKLTKAEKKRAKRQERNLRIASKDPAK
jgi:hypothetical protein